MPVAVLGMRGSGSFVSDERPKNFRQALMLLFPSGATPLTAILSMLREEETTDPEFAWFEKGLPIQRGWIRGASVTVSAQPADGADVAAASTADEIALSVSNESGTVVDASWIKPGHVLLSETTDEIFYVVDTGGTGTGAWIVVARDWGDKFGAEANNPAVTGDATEALGDKIVIVGAGFPEGAPIGSSIAYGNTKYRNFTQIFRTPLFLTRTARKTKLRFDAMGPIREAKREALQIHGLEMEKAFLFSERSEQHTNALVGTGGLPAEISGNSTDTPIRTTRGIVNWLPTIDLTGSPTSVHHDIGASNGGILTEPDLDAWLEHVFRHGSSEKLALLGSTALNVLNQAAKNKMQLTAVPSDQDYGLGLQRLITPFGNLMLKQHPLMSVNDSWRKDIIVIDVDKLKYRYVDDTRYLKNRQSPGDDATKDEYLTEAGLECNFGGRVPGTGDSGSTTPPSAHGRLKGISAYGG